MYLLRGCFIVLTFFISSLAQAAWSPPVNLSVNGNAPSLPKVKVDQNDNAVAIWHQGNAGPLMGSVYSKTTNTWITTSDLTPNQAINNFQLGMSPSGYAVAVWDNGAATLASGSTTWVSTVTSSGSQAQVVVDSAGNAISVWTESSIIKGAFLPFGSTVWTPTTELSSPSLTSSVPQITVDASGNVVAVWLSFDGTNSYILGATLASGSLTWSSASNVSPALPLSPNYVPQVASDAFGNAIAIWQDGPVSGTVQGAKLVSGSNTWVATSSVSGSSGSFADAQIAMDPAGDAVVVWRDSPNSLVQGARLDAGTLNWTATTNLSSTIGSTTKPQIVMDSSGNAVAVYVNGSAPFQVQAASLPSGSTTWIDITTISGNVLPAASPEVAISPSGFAVAVWTGFPFITQAATNQISPAPPSDFTGIVITNRFATQTDIIHVLSWTPSSDPDVIGYRIYQSTSISPGQVLIAEIPADGPFSLVLHNRCPNVIYTYTLVGFDAAGFETGPLIVILP